MNKKEIEKEYQKFLKDTKRSGTKSDKETFKNKCAIYFIECFGIGNQKTLKTIENLNKF